jgi:agmatine deiminase
VFSVAKRFSGNGKRKTENGFTMPAEWEPHAATWLAWPHNRTDWPGKFEPIPYVYAEIVRHLSRHERVHLIVNDRAAEEKARKVLTHANVVLENVTFHRWVTNRGWMRDSGPIFVKPSKGDMVALNWRFNAWAKYPDWQLDNKLPDLIARYLKLDQIKPSLEDSQPATRNSQLVLEGGSIDVNGCGTMLTTEECLLSEVQQRNPGVSREQLESIFERVLGVRKVIWLGRGVTGDDTHGHVDDLARFVSPDTVLTVIEENPADENYEPLQENLERLRTATDQDGQPLRVVTMPMPAPVVYQKRRLPASYANFYIANGVVLVPTFDDPNDRIALNTLAELFPARQIVPIYAGDLIWGLGAIHCMTQQQPE